MADQSAMEATGSGETAGPRVIKLRPHPELPSEYRELLREELAKIPNGVHSLIQRLERIANNIEDKNEAVPIEMLEDEDSLVINVREVLSARR